MSVVWAMRSLISISFVFHSSSFNRRPLSATPGWNFVCATVSPQQCLSNSFKCLTDKGPFSSFLCLSPHGNWLCDVLGFVPASSVSSSSTFQIFRDASHFWWLFPLSVCFLSHSLDSVMSRTVHPQGSSKMDVEHGVEHNMQRTGRFTPHHMTCSVLSPPRFTWHHLG